MDSRLLLSALLVLMVALVGTSLATTTVNQGDTLVIDGDYTDTDFVVKGTMILEGDANAVFTARSWIDGARDFEDEVGAEIIMNGGSFLVDNARMDMGHGSPGDSYLIINDGYFQVTGDGTDKEGYLVFADDPGGVHRIFVNGGTLRVYALQIEPARDAHVYVGGGTIIAEDTSGNNNADPLSGWLTDCNNPDGLPVMMPAEGYEEVIVVPFESGEMAYAIRGPKAAFPDPANEAENVCPDGLVLNWMPGAQTQPTDGHDVYLGTNLDSVNNATTSTATIYKGRQDTNSYPEGDSLNLDPGITYYWRIDEVNDSDPNIWKGSVWSFTTNDGNAFDPDPADGEGKIPLDTNLSWQPGCWANSHDVYFSDDRDAVENRSGSAFLTNTGGTTADPCAGDLDYFTNYYWAVDEVGSSETWYGPVWGFRTRAEVVDPNLIIQYKFDETAGSIANDWSGNEFNGDVNGVSGDTWDTADSQDGGGSINMDGGQRVDVPIGAVSLIGDKEVSVSLWFKAASNPDAANWVFCLHGGLAYVPDHWDLKAAVPDSVGGVRFVAGARPAGEPEPEEADSNDVLQWTGAEGASPDVWEPAWHHLVFMKNENAGTMSIYYDGVLVERRSDVYAGTLAELKSKAQGFYIGAHYWHSSGGVPYLEDTYNGKIDDFRLYDYALSDGEVELLYRGGNLGLAWAPYPYHGQRYLQRDASLSWRAGAYATHHDVYFGTSFADVNSANTSTSGIYKARQLVGDVDYDPPGNLAFDTTYYWRIDEVNTLDPNMWKGRVWRFSVANYLLVDDFEGYDDDAAAPVNPISYIYGGTWADGWWTYLSGSTVYLEYGGQDPKVHGGTKSMALEYDNAMYLGGYSEVEAATTGTQSLDCGKNWIDGGLEALGLYFYGDPTNDVEQLYVALADTPGDIHVSNYGDGGEDLNDVGIPEWHQWDVALSEFSDNAVDTADVNRIYIGLGDRDYPVAGGSGTLYIDDVRVYIPRCVPEKRRPLADLNGDCTVDWRDLEMLGDDWLESDKVLTVSEPQDTPVGEWKLDEGTGSLAGDTGSGGNNGTLEGTYSWAAGYENSAVEFFDGRVLVPDAAVLRPQYEVTTCAWIKYSNPQSGNNRVVVKGADNWETYVLWVSGSSSLAFSINEHTAGPNEPNTFQISENALYMNEWAHIAGTYDGTYMKLFVNGEVVDSSDEASGITLSQETSGLAIGNKSDAIDTPFAGIIDEVCVYDVALTEAEVAYVALGPTGYRRLVSEANFYDEETQGSKAVNFRDLAIMASGEMWLTPKENWLWP